MKRKWIFAAAAASALLLVPGAASSADAGASAKMPAVSFTGIGALEWSARLPLLEEEVGASFDCSVGLVPGKCLCPMSTPDLPITFLFDLKSHQNSRLQGFFGYEAGVHTDRGVAIGSSKKAVRRAYPGARLKVNAPLTSGLSTFFIARHQGHALVFTLEAGKVDGILGFADGRRSNIEAEQCA